MPLSPARRLQHPIPPPTRLSAARSHPSTLRRASVPLAGLWCGAESRSNSPALKLSREAERLAHPQAQRAFLGQRAFSVGIRHVRRWHAPSDKGHLPWSGCTSLQSHQDLTETRTCGSAPKDSRRNARSPGRAEARCAVISTRCSSSWERSVRRTFHPSLKKSHRSRFA